MDPLTMMAALQSGVALGQSIFGAIKGTNNKRPDYDIPESAKQALELAKINATGQMPGYTQAKDQNNLTTANLISAGANNGNITQMLPAIAARASLNNRNLSTDNANYQAGARRELRGAYNQYGKYEDQEFQMNEFAPYAQKFQESRDMVGAGLQNFNTAISNYGMYQLSNSANMLSQENRAVAANNAGTVMDSANFNAAHNAAIQMMLGTTPLF